MRKLIGVTSVAFALSIAPVAAETVTVAALGDSLTQGYGLPQGEGFVPQLEAWLADQGAEAAILNAGVSGDTTAGGLARVDWTLTPDVDAMIVALGGNDLLRGIDPAASRANIKGILEKAQSQGIPVLLVGMLAPGNFGPEYKAEFDAMYPELAESYGTLFAPSFLAALEAFEDRQTTVAKYVQSDGVHPNAEGVALIVADLGPRVLALIDQARTK